MLYSKASNHGARISWADLEDSSDESITSDEHNNVEGNQRSHGPNADLNKTRVHGTHKPHALVTTRQSNSEQHEASHAMQKSMKHQTLTSVFQFETQCKNLHEAVLQGPQDFDGLPSSLGTIVHASGQCIPCFFHAKGKCVNGIGCKFCHADHFKKNIARPSKSRRERIQKHILSIATKVSHDSTLDTLETKVTKCLNSMELRLEHVDIKYKAMVYIQGMRKRAAKGNVAGRSLRPG